MSSRMLSLKDKTKVVLASGHMEDSVVKQLQHGVERRREAVEGGAHTLDHWTSLSLVYSTQTFVYINTCPVHGEVHNNDM